MNDSLKHYTGKDSGIDGWFDQRRVDCSLVARPSDKPLQTPWKANPDDAIVVNHDNGRFFVIRNVDVLRAEAAEVTAWSQPMLEECDAMDWRGKKVSGLICMARVQLEDTVAYLIQAKAQPGTNPIYEDGPMKTETIEAARTDNVLITTSIQASFSNALNHPGKIPLWAELGIDLTLPSGQMTEPHVAMPQDPGRFLGKRNLYLRRDLTIEEAANLKLPHTHVWATREAIRGIQLQGFGSDFLAQYLGSGLE